MIPVRNIPDKARPMYMAPPPRYPYRLHINQMDDGFGGAPIPLLLPEFYDPAFLRFQSNVPVYCSTICVELMQENVAGLGKEDALVDLYLLIDTYPEGQRPMTD
jgi:hypothetical protein